MRLMQALWVRYTALICLLVLVCGSAVAVWTSHWNYAAQDRESISAGRSADHATGTDDLGRDRTVRTGFALLLALAGAVAASALATLLGVAVGACAAFTGPLAARTLMYGSDLLLTLPWLFLLMIVRSALPLNLPPAASAAVTFMVLGLLGWPVFARVHFARAGALRHASWMLAARAGGLRPLQLARTHVLPHLLPLLLAQFLIYLPVCITAESNLGAMGLGISEPLPSWGSMLLSLKSAAVISTTHWIFLPLALLVLVLFLLQMTAYQMNRTQEEQ